MAASTTHPPLLDLPRLVMRRAGTVALTVLVVALALGGLRLRADIDDELAGARAAAHALATLAPLSARDDAAALATLAQLQQAGAPRHLRLTVQAADGSLLLALPAGVQAASATAAASRWPLARPAGPPWTVALEASADSERVEAAWNLAGTLALLLLCIAGMLLAMRLNLRRAFQPLGRLLGAIGSIEQGDAAAVRALPPMPVRELETLAGAVRHLADALDAAEARRRLLAQQLLTLQEDERQRLARELHDEFGQRLTALRVDAAWLARRVADQPALRTVVDGMAAQCEQVQQDIRTLLRRLEPFGPDTGPGAGPDADGGTPLARLHELLQSLAAAWQGSTLPVALELGSADITLPRPLALALYRISQEALTNVARHAGATQATLRLLPVDAGTALHWSVCDDGIGLTDETSAQQRGNGLAGMRERIWALGSSLQMGPAPAHAGVRPGLCLSARFQLSAA